MNTSVDDVRENQQIADKLREEAALLEAQGANPFRAGAYRKAADTIARRTRPVREMFEAEGVTGLDALPHIGKGIAAAIAPVQFLRERMFDRKTLNVVTNGRSGRRADGQGGQPLVPLPAGCASPTQSALPLIWGISNGAIIPWCTLSRDQIRPWSAARARARR